jgi:aminoglycoside phosphotransferase (APT) family kinase protein
MVSSHAPLPLDRLGPLLAEVLGDQAWVSARVELITGGKSNLTYEVTAGGRSVILRRPPTGAVPATAHDMGREASVMRALAGTGVPVPVILFADTSGEVLGAPFSVMSKVDGVVIRDNLPTGLSDSNSAKRRLSDALVDTLAAIHVIDVNSVGLADFGRPNGFMSRQLRRWSAQWEAGGGHSESPVVELSRRLAPRLPDDGGSGLVHGDFRLDNCVVDRADLGRIVAVLDWEMSTLGDPLADLGMLLFYWVEPGERHRALTPAVTATAGFATRDEVVARYAAASDPDLSALPVYHAFAHFKFAVVAQGISERSRTGVMAGQEFGDLREEVSAIAESGLDILRREGL